MDDLVEWLWEIRKALGSFLKNAHYHSRFIEDDSEEFNMMGVKNWIDKLRRFVCEAEDLLDEIETLGFMSLKTKKIEMQFSLDGEDMYTLSCHRNAGDHHWKLLSLWGMGRGRVQMTCIENNTSRQRSEERLRTAGQWAGDPDDKDLSPACFRRMPTEPFYTTRWKKLLTSMNKVKQMNNTRNGFYLYNNESCVVLDIDLMETFDWGEKMTSELHWFDRNVPRYPMFQHGDAFNQHKRKKIAQRVSSFVVSTIAFLGIFFELWSQLSIIQVQPLHKEHHPVSIWPPLLGLLGFMVFVWAVAIMILVGAPFTRMQSAMLIFWAILMLLKSANSISAVFVPILAILFMGWYVCSWKKQPPNEGNE